MILFEIVFVVLLCALGWHWGGFWGFVSAIVVYLALSFGCLVWNIYDNPRFWNNW